MATTTTVLLLLLLAASTSARPCRTTFFTSTSYYTLSQNPNPSPHFVTLYLTSASNSRNWGPNPNRFFLIPKPFSTRLVFDRIGAEEARPMKKIESFSDLPSRVYDTVMSSIKDMSKDVMSVVGALLFGMGCGALTAATMYLVLSLFMPNRFEFEGSDDEVEFEGGDGFDDLYDPRKMGNGGGYAALPSKVVDDQDLKKVVNGSN